MTIFGAVGSVVRKYADFSGRASRSEYWLFQLAMVFLSAVALGIINLLAPQERGSDSWPTSVVVVTAVYLMVALFFFIPSWAVTVRRLHDAGLSGLWILVQLVPTIGSLVFLVLLVLPSTARRAPLATAGPYVNPRADTRFATDGANRFGISDATYATRQAIAPSAPQVAALPALTPTLTPTPAAWGRTTFHPEPLAGAAETAPGPTPGPPAQPPGYFEPR